MTFRDRWTGRFAKAPPPPPVTQYRIVVRVGDRIAREFPWRVSERRAMDDAKNAKLASYDEEQREWFLAVPVSLQSRKVTPDVDPQRRKK